MEKQLAYYHSVILFDLNVAFRILGLFIRGIEENSRSKREGLYTGASTRGKAQTEAGIVCGLVSLVPKRLLPIWDYEGPRDSHGAKSLWLAPTGHSRS